MMIQINATTIKAEDLRSVKSLMYEYLTAKEDIEDYNREILELETRQRKTCQDLSDEIEMSKCHKSIEEVKLRRVKIQLSIHGILIDG